MAFSSTPEQSPIRRTPEADTSKGSPRKPAARAANSSSLGGIWSVSYTHLDVYKRQALNGLRHAGWLALTGKIA